jgi:hypothetical protein
MPCNQDKARQRTLVHDMANDIPAVLLNRRFEVGHHASVAEALLYQSDGKGKWGCRRANDDSCMMALCTADEGIQKR